MQIVKQILTLAFGPSWKTSLIGFVTAACIAGATYAQGQGAAGWALVAYALSAGIAALGRASKDSNTTGGSVPVTPEAAARVAKA